LPSVPTIAEAGVADFVQTTWWGIWAPAGTPARVVDKIVQDVARAVSSPGLRGEFAKLGFEPMISTQADFARFVRSEMEAAARIAKAAGIKPQ
jgi:tripartite-type tricarboxylate transporter receptor subunit TctC